MAYVSRTDALNLIVEQNSNSILQGAAKTSVAMATFRTVNMGTSILNMPLLETFPQAQWLTATPPADVDIVAKPTTNMTWGVKQLFAEEAATIVPIPENVLDDASFNLWSEVETRVAESIARLIDQTVFFGTAPAGNIPASFPVGGLVGEATAAGHIVTPVDNLELLDDFSAAMEMVEADGYDVNTAYSGTGMRAPLRTLKDGDGRYVYTTDVREGTPVNSIFGVPLYWVSNGSWDATEAQAIVGDRNMAVLGIRQRLTAKRLSEATINGFNLAEQDMLALRVKIRLGFAVLVPKALGQSADPYPFAVLGPKAPVVP